MSEIDLNLADLVGALEEERWEDFPGLAGFALLLHLPGAPEQLAVTSRVLQGAEENAQGGFNLDDQQTADLHYRRGRLAIRDWRGLTAAHLRELLPGVVLNIQAGGAPAPEDLVRFNPGLRDLLLRQSTPFISWVTGWLWREHQRREDLEKNLSATPSITPTPSPAPAKAAGPKKRRSA